VRGIASEESGEGISEEIIQGNKERKQIGLERNRREGESEGREGR
jgi:hypothetical protein